MRSAWLVYTQISYLIVVDVLVATVVTILQLLQHIISLKSGAFIAHCQLVTVSRPRYSIYPSQVTRVPIDITDDRDSKDKDADQGKTTRSSGTGI